MLRVGCVNAKRLVIGLTFCFLSLPFPGNATAGSTAGPFVLRDGFWWRDGLPHTRRAIVSTRWFNGCAQRFRSFSYHRAPLATKTVTKTVIKEVPVVKWKTKWKTKTIPAKLSHRDPDWKSHALRIKERLLSGELSILKDHQDYRFFLDTIQALGLQSYVDSDVKLRGTMQFGFDGGGYYNQGSGYVPNAQQADETTFFPGYQQTQYRTVTDIYGLDPNVLMQQRTHAQDASFALSSKIDDGTVNVLKQLAANDQDKVRGLQRIEELRAKVELLRAANVTDVRTRSTTTQTRPAPNIPNIPNVPGTSTGRSDPLRFERNDSEMVAEFKRLVNRKCYRCHGGDKVEKGDSGLFPSGLDFTEGRFSEDQIAEIVRRMVKGEMPPDGSPEGKLSLEELTWTLAWVRSHQGD